MKIYQSIEYARSRLIGTIIRATIEDKLRAVLVQDIDRDVSTVKIMKTSALLVIPTECLDINPVPLGYINAKKKSTYVVRVPMRNDWKQGLRSNNVTTMDGSMDYNDLQPAQVADCIENVYPDIKYCIGRVLKSVDPDETKAFSREFAIHFDGHLLYRTFPVGTINKEGDVKFNKGFEYAEDSFWELNHG